MTNAKKMAILMGRKSRMSNMALPLDNWHEHNGVLYRVSDHGYIMFEPPLRVLSVHSGRELLLSNLAFKKSEDGHAVAQLAIDESLGPSYRI